MERQQPQQVEAHDHGQQGHEGGNEARHLPPEVLNYVPKMLPSLGIDPAQITSASFWKAGETRDRYIGNRLDQEYARLRSAMIGIDQYDLLHVTADGERFLCALLVVPAR